MKYIAYKIINSIFLFFYKKNFYSDILFSKENIKINSVTDILFDFSHSSTHLGDRLFFFPLIESLHHAGIKIHLSKKDKISIDLFQSLNDSIKFYQFSYTNNVDLILVPAPSLLALWNEHKGSQLVICNFNDIMSDNILKELDLGISKLANIEISSKNKYANLPFFKSNFLPSTSDKYFIYSNYIDSGWFRKYFVNTNSLDEKAKSLRAQGYKIVHVGSIKDLKDDSKNYEFIDQDLRAKISISELSYLIRDDRVIGSITYDNFIMHLSGIYNKKTFVLFRGRFFKKNILKHLNYINPVFFHINNEINYLK